MRLRLEKRVKSISDRMPATPSSETCADPWHKLTSIVWTHPEQPDDWIAGGPECPTCEASKPRGLIVFEWQD